MCFFPKRTCEEVLVEQTIAANSESTNSRRLRCNFYALVRRAEVFAGDPDTAEPHYQGAVALDSRFAVAQTGLTRVQAPNTPKVAKPDTR
jgi:hypothetical protein